MRARLALRLPAPLDRGGHWVAELVVLGARRAARLRRTRVRASGHCRRSVSAGACSRLWGALLRGLPHRRGACNGIVERSLERRVVLVVFVIGVGFHVNVIDVSAIFVSAGCECSGRRRGAVPARARARGSCSVQQNCPEDAQWGQASHTPASSKAVGLGAACSADLPERGRRCCSGLNRLDARRRRGPRVAASACRLRRRQLACHSGTRLLRSRLQQQAQGATLTGIQRRLGGWARLRYGCGCGCALAVRERSDVSGACEPRTALHSASIALVRCASSSAGRLRTIDATSLPSKCSARRRHVSRVASSLCRSSTGAHDASRTPSRSGTARRRASRPASASARDMPASFGSRRSNTAGSVPGSTSASHGMDSACSSSLSCERAIAASCSPGFGRCAAATRNRCAGRAGAGAEAAECAGPWQPSGGARAPGVGRAARSMLLAPDCCTFLLSGPLPAA